jgi:hypothetical protein
MRFLALAILLAAGTANAQPAQMASLDLLRRAASPNPGLQTYTASAELSATLHALVPVHRTFTGTVYYLKPKRKIEFQNVSGPLSRFKDLASSTPSYEELTADYAVTPLGDDGKLSNYSLVPKKAGSRVEKLNVTIDDALALVRHAQWIYTSGGTLAVDQSYTMVGTFQLPAKANIAARFPGYSVDGTLSFSGYKPNAAVSPAVFASP